MKKRIVALLFAVVAVGSTGLAPSAAHAATPGAGIAAITVQTGGDPNPTPVGARVDVVIKGPLVANGKAAEVDLTIGRFLGTEYGCQTSHCGDTGPTIDLTGTVATVRGKIGDGSAVTGQCHGGTVDLGFFGGIGMTTQCAMTIRGASTGSFRLDVEGLGLWAPPFFIRPAFFPAKYFGFFCTDTPVGCSWAVDVGDPFS
jgi:hypothetical protein